MSFAIILGGIALLSFIFLFKSIGDFPSDFFTLTKRLIEDDRLGRAFLNTSVITIVSIALQLLLGLLMTLCIGSLSKAAKVFLILPASLPAWTAALSFYLLCSPGIGLISLIGVGDQHLSFLFIDQIGIWGTIIAIDSWQWLPLTFLVLSSQLDNLDPAHVAIAQLEGASRTRILFSVLLPHLKNTFLALIIIRGFDLIRIFDIPAILWGASGANPKAETITMYLYRLMFQDGNSSYAAFISFVLCVPLGLALTLCRKTIKDIFLGKLYNV
ncbi:sugar ABC transporter permease [Ereboglobus sp. PH5-10]|uniref:carbohydrate ABC transporter permease n=1 Tax=Ereboglobus sp. PH5-10 TaxID=2940629 RepID=UPI00240638C0|nr:sugar ABC transporter permease [Ereboglobus sp. PH5-10]